MVPFPRARCVLFAALFGCALAAPAAACTIIVNPHRTSLWERVWDWSPPEPAAMPVVRVHRGRGPRPTNTPGVFASSSCDDIGSVTLDFPPRRRGEVVGYTFEILAGEAPRGFLPDAPLRTLPRRDGTHGLTLSWIDGATDKQEPLAFVLGIRTVDRAGNRSREVVRVLIRDPGREG